MSNKKGRLKSKTVIVSLLGILQVLWPGLYEKLGITQGELAQAIVTSICFVLAIWGRIVARTELDGWW